MDIQVALSIASSVAQIAIALIALDYAIRTYRMKSGHDLQFGYKITSSYTSSDPYVSNITLVNRKDRAVVVSGIYLRLDRNVTLELEKFKNEPLVIPPFGAVSREYEPVNGYVCVNDGVNVSDLLSGSRIGECFAIVATSDGPVRARRHGSNRQPSMDGSRNHFHYNIRPFRTILNGKCYGDRARFLLKFYKGSECIREHPIYDTPIGLRELRILGIAEQDFPSKDQLEEKAKLLVVANPEKYDRSHVIDLHDGFPVVGDKHNIPEPTLLTSGPIGIIRTKAKKILERISAQS